MANKQTAVDKLYIHLLGIVSFDSEQLRNMYEESFKQAKQMHKEQIENAFDAGYFNHEVLFYDNAEEYYNETYGK